MPTCGTQYFVYDVAKEEWLRMYAENLKPEDRNVITAALEVAIDEAGYRIKILSDHS